jgi:hypothetical protein
MIVDSTQKCVQTYNTKFGEINIIPGRNLIRDDVGRELMQSKPFVDMVKSRALGFAGTVTVVMAPAEDPAAAKPGAKAKEAAIPADGETAVSGMTVKDAVLAINECRVVDQLQDILTRDERAGVKKAAAARIAVLAAEAESGKKVGDDDENDDDDDDDNEPE